MLADRFGAAEALGGGGVGVVIDRPVHDHRRLARQLVGLADDRLGVIVDDPFAEGGDFAYGGDAPDLGVDLFDFGDCGLSRDR